MLRKRFLIIGGAGEEGQSAIGYLKKNDTDCIIIASTSDNSNISGVDTYLIISRQA